MLPTIASGNVASATAGGFEVANSCRFNDGDDPSLKKTPGSDGSLTNWTFSCWVKRSTISNAQQMIAMALASSGNDTQINFSSGDQIEFFNRSGGSVNGMLLTNRLFRDVASWYHIVAVWNSDDGTAGNRMRLYINGTEETSFATDTNPSADTESKFNSACEHCIGQANSGSADFDGYMAEVCFIDGQALTPTSFGEFDEDSPTIWKPKDVSGLTFGSNGTYLDFEDSDNLGDDESGNTNDWTEANLAATDQSSDSPTNNFATLNPLSLYTNTATALALSEGNLKAAAGSGSVSWFARYAFSNIGVSAGKWWVEIKCVDSGASNQFYLGIVTNPETKTWDSALGDLSGAWGYYSNDGSIYHSGSHTGGTKVTYGDGDFVGIALDCDNGTVQFYKNGAVSSDQVTGLSTTADWFFALDGYAAIDAEFNFGNPPYSISSGNADGNNLGNFEHAPPSGFLAICTKNLGSDGG